MTASLFSVSHILIGDKPICAAVPVQIPVLLFRNLFSNNIYLFIYLFKADSWSVTEKGKKKHTQKNKTAKTAQKDSNSKILKLTYFKQYCPYKIIGKTNVHVRKTTITKNNKAYAYNK